MTNEVTRNIERKAKELYNTGVVVTNIPSVVPFLKDEIIIAFYNIVSEWYQGSLRITNNSYGQTVIRWLDYTKYHNSIATFIEQLRTTGVGLVANYHGTGQQNYFLRNVYSVIKIEGIFDGLVTHRKKVGTSIQITIPAIVERIEKEKQARIQENFNFWKKTGILYCKNKPRVKKVEYKSEMFIPMTKEHQVERNLIMGEAIQNLNKHLIAEVWETYGWEGLNHEQRVLRNRVIAKQISEKWLKIHHRHAIEIETDEFGDVLIKATKRLRKESFIRGKITYTIITRPDGGVRTSHCYLSMPYPKRGSSSGLHNWIQDQKEAKAKDAQDKKNFLYNNAMQLWNKKHLVVKGVHNGAEFTHYDNIALAKEIAEEFINMFDDYRIEIIHEEARILIMITPQFSIDRLTKSFISHVIQKQKEQPIEKIEVTFKGSLHYIWKSDHDALIKHRAKLEYKFMPKYIAGCDPFDKGAASSKASIEHFMFPPQVEHSDWYNQMLQRSWDMKVRAWSKKKKVEKELAWLESKIFPTTRKEAF